MSLIQAALEAAARLLRARLNVGPLTQAQTRQLGRCGGEIGGLLFCQRPARHEAGECCGISSSRCDHDHNDPCTCGAGNALCELGYGWPGDGRCRCGGFVE